MHPLTAHSTLVTDLTFSPDGQTLASASWDHTLKFWDVATGRLTQTVHEDDWIHRAVFSPDGTRLVYGGDFSGGAFGPIRVLQAASEGEISTWRRQKGAEESQPPAAHWSDLAANRAAAASLFSEVSAKRLPRQKGDPPALDLLNTPGQTNNWLLYDSQAKSTVERLDGGKMVRLNINQIGQQVWDAQYLQRGLTLKNGHHYILQLLARADSSRSLPVVVQDDEAPYGNIGLGDTLAINSQWKAFRIPFDVHDARPEHGSITFLLAGTAGTVWLRNIALVPDDSRLMTED